MLGKTQVQTAIGRYIHIPFYEVASLRTFRPIDITGSTTTEHMIFSDVRAADYVVRSKKMEPQPRSHLHWTLVTCVRNSDTASCTVRSGEWKWEMDVASSRFHRSRGFILTSIILLAITVLLRKKNKQCCFFSSTKFGSLWKSWRQLHVSGMAPLLASDIPLSATQSEGLPFSPLVCLSLPLQNQQFE